MPTEYSDWSDSLTVSTPSLTHSTFRPLPDWDIFLANVDGTGAQLAQWLTARVTWTLGGPGAVEVDLDDVSVAPLGGPAWLAGQRRVIVTADDTAIWAGYLTHLGHSGEPHSPHLSAAGLGLRSILDKRVVHGDYTRFDVPAVDIAFSLIENAAAQAVSGAMNFTDGTHVGGTGPDRRRYFCTGDKIGDQIADLAAREPGGFDWEIGPDGAFNTWIDGRGDDLDVVLTKDPTQGWEVTDDTEDILTYATALGRPEDQDCGPPAIEAGSGLALAYGRREDSIDVDSTDPTEMLQAAQELIRASIDGRRKLRVTYYYEQQPFPFGSVWLGDKITAVLEPYFGGEQIMRCTEISASLEPNHILWFEYEFETVA